MILYLVGHFQPVISYEVNSMAKYMFGPKHSHELELKRIDQHLKVTIYRGLVLNKYP